MNQLRSWLYGHDTRTSFAKRKEKENEDTPKDSAVLPDAVNVQNSDDGIVRRNLLKVIPLRPGDCLECKLVGSGVMAISGGVVAVSAMTARQRNPKLTKFHGGLYVTLCGGFFVALETIALCRLMDWKPFKT